MPDAVRPPGQDSRGMGIATQTPQRQAHRPAPRERNTRSPTQKPPRFHAGTIPTWPQTITPRATPQPNLGRPRALFGAIAFSGKAIIIKLAYRAWRRCRRAADVAHAAGAADVLLLSWWGARPTKLTARDWRDIRVLGFTGYYLSSYLDFAGLQYISASLERLIPLPNPTMVLLIAVLRQGQRISGRQVVALLLSYAGMLAVFGHELHFEGRGHGARQSAGLWAVPSATPST